MADESKRIVIVVEGDQAGQEPVDTPNYTLRTVASTTTEADLVKEDFARRMDELAANFESTFGNLSDLPQLKDEKITPDDPDTEDIDLLALTDKAEEANRLLQQIADELIQDESDSGGMGGGIGSPPQPPPPPGAPQQETFDDALRSMLDLLTGNNRGGGGGAGGGGGNGGGGGGGGVGGIVQGAAAGGAAGGTPGAIIGGIMAAGGDGGDGDAGSFLGMITGGPLAALVQVVDSIYTVMEQVYGILMDIDAHILSLADDVRGYSADVAAAEAEGEVMRINWQVDRAEAIGPELGEYIRERNELDYQIAQFVTELEATFLPMAVDAMKVINVALPPVLQTVKESLWFVIGFMETMASLIPGMRAFLDAARADREKELDPDIQKLLFEFLGGAGTGGMNPPDADKGFPAGAGVFF